MKFCDVDIIIVSCMSNLIRIDRKLNAVRELNLRVKVNNLTLGSKKVSLSIGMKFDKNEQH